MTVPSNKNREDYVGDGATTEWDYTFKIFDDSNLVVIYTDADDVDHELTLNTDYTVTNAGHPDGGKVKLQSGGTLSSATLTSSESLTLLRKLPITQLIDLRNQRAFFADTHEDVFDRLTMIAQQFDEALGSQFRPPESVDPADAQIKISSSDWAKRESKLLGFDSDGDVTVGPHRDILFRAPSATGIEAQDVELSGTDWGNRAKKGLGFDLNGHMVVFDRSIDVTVDGTAIIVDSVANLRVGSFSENVERIWLSGYYGVGTAGGGPLYRDSDDTTTADDGGMVFVDSNGVRWKRPVGNAVDIRWYGAKVDGAVTDDTTALHAAIDRAKSLNGAIYVPPGGCRVTSGYVQGTDRESITLIGDGNDWEGDAKGSYIVLDNASASSFFYEVSGRHRIQAYNLSFECAQEVTDRDFFKFTASNHAFDFENVRFRKVEKPCVFIEGSYFQSSALRNVTFDASGSIHSQVGGAGETNSLRGTLLVLDNVNHENAVPDNSDKVLCDLTGIRSIQARNFLLEGSSPGTGWTILRVNNTYNSDWTRFPTVEFSGFHIEFAGTDPDFYVHQSGGHVRISQPGGLWNTSSPYKLDSSAHLTLENASFSGTNDSIEDYFDVADMECHVHLIHCTGRRSPKARWFGIEGWTRNSSTEDTRSRATLSKIGNSPIWRFDGGYVNDPATLQIFTGSSTPSVDTTYGRKLVLQFSGGDFNGTLRVPFRSPVTTEDTVSISLLAKMPTWTSKTSARINFTNTNSSVIALAIPDSGELVEVNEVLSLVNIDTDEIGINFSFSVSGISGDLEIYALSFDYGNQLHEHAFQAFGRVVTENNAAPTTGEWEAGDVVYNTSPSFGDVVGWYCVSGGIPGTWAVFGQTGRRTNAGDPNGSVTPNFTGEELLDTTNDVWYKSVGVGASDWKALNS